MYMGRWDMDALQDPSMWQEAAGQVFFSIGVSLGVRIPAACSPLWDQ